MIELALRTTAILALAWTMVRLFPRATAATRHLIWHLAIVGVLVAPVATPLTPTFQLPFVASLLQTRAAAGSVEPSTMRAGANTGGAGGAVSSLVRAPGDASREAALALIPIVWAIGSGVLSLWFVMGWLTAAMTIRRARPAPAAWRLDVEAVRARLHISRDVRVRMVEGQAGPVLAGLWRPVILVPQRAADWSADRRRTVLLHELAHVRRRDLHVQVLAQAACTAYWFNPLVWIAAAELRAARERACDDAVLSSGERPSTYAGHLLSIARELRPPLRPCAALAMARPSELEGRLHSVLAAGRRRAPARATRWAVAVMAGASTVTALGASLSPAVTPGTSLAVVPRGAATVFRVVAAEAAAGERGSPRADVRALERALADVDQDAREQAAMRLASLSTPDAIPGLLRALADADAQVREKAAMGLMLRDSARVDEALLAVVDDPDAQVREKVAIALATSNDARAPAALRRLAGDDDARVREQAATALQQLHRIAPGPAR